MSKSKPGEQSEAEMIASLPAQARHYYERARVLPGRDRVRALRAAQQHLESRYPEYLSQLNWLQRLIVETNQGAAS